MPRRKVTTDLRGVTHTEPAESVTPTQELLHPTDALAAAAARLGTDGKFDELHVLAEQLAPAQLELLVPGLELVRATESRASENLSFDASVASSVLRPDRTLSPTFLEGLGRCPLRAFFGRVLRVGELYTPLPLELDAGESGTLVHDVLHAVYTRLLEEGLLRAGSSATTARTRAGELLPGLIAAAASGFGERLRSGHPVLWQSLEASVTTALESFLERDLDALLPAGIRSLSAETGLELRRGSPHRLGVCLPR